MTIIPTQLKLGFVFSFGSTGEKYNSTFLSGLSVGLTNQLRVEPATAQLGLKLSSAIKGAIKLRFVQVNIVTMSINIMRGG